MSLLSRLSSQVGDRTEAANREAASWCLEHPESLAEIAEGLAAPSAALVGDCAEVLTLVAETQPSRVAPYLALLHPLLAHGTTRVRWEAMHAIALVAATVPDATAALLPDLASHMRSDPSVIVRDHATDAIGNYAATGSDAAECAYPLLLEALWSWNGKQAGHALAGLTRAAPLLRSKHAELLHIAEEFAGEDRAVVRQAARRLLKAVSSG